MATSSITEPFYSKDAKAANTIVRLMFAEKVPASYFTQVLKPFKVEAAGLLSSNRYDQMICVLKAA